ncbi:aquaporin-11 isoform X1 [Sitodiplosis mosellana]|uniref:aquaporin-11 isoform X1 n=2 Tax=Sitodiplosis mosellana TaxID=263140 RepID=UPI002444BC83|nr:aquaporin-11 isoform X1 [Sitodiplosis mosellana]XP_055304881.1 aquaporin-11 isoform X1 [Sitodiplosis mosellana]XP_055304882.1 aquaporin-11 isoform X1 [Sitodiplosis mosellana]XP_055304883.1 aquaporin-11 isoform X1 [Sitodiplosis mosellana]
MTSTVKSFTEMNTALAISASFIGLCCLLAAIARIVVSRTVKSCLVKELLYEAIAAAELCSCCFELIIVADNFGIAAYAIFLFFLTILWSMVWGDATACCYVQMEDWIQGNTSLRLVLLKTFAQLMGGCCVYRFVQIFWWFEFAHTHENRAFESCTTDLQVNAYLGAFIEGFATLLCRLASRTIADLGMRHAAFIDSFIGTGLVVAAFNYSGGYFNPILATALKWGCSGYSNIDHIIVYWCGACTGALLSVVLYKYDVIKKLVGEESLAKLKPKAD